MASTSKRYPVELKDQAARMVAEIRSEHGSEWIAVESVAEKLGVGTAQTVQNWVRRAEVDVGKRPGVSTETAKELRKLRSENRVEAGQRDIEVGVNFFRGGARPPTEVSSHTRAGYTADWALFTDWCTATGHTPLPADWTTITAFSAGCPGAPATLRRRLAAITHHHRVAGHAVPTDPTRQVGPPARELIDPGQVDMLMRLLPSHGWTAGLFGRRDRALLTLAAATTIPYRQLPGLTVGQLHIADGTATITDHRGTKHVVEAAADPALCGPCTLVRWRRVLDTEVRHKSVKTLLKKAEVVTGASHHSCRSPKPIDARTFDAPLFPPINQWGHLPLPIRPLSPHSASRLARQADTGLAHHKALDVDDFVAVLNSDQEAVEPTSVATPPKWDWAAANQRKKDAVQQLAPLADALDDLEARIAELVVRTKDLTLG